MLFIHHRQKEDSDPLFLFLHEKVTNKWNPLLVSIEKPNAMEKMKITVFADPACTWCWGSVPVLRALSYQYGEQLEISYVMGGMIEDILSYNNRRLSIGGDIAMSNRNMYKHWLEASAIHGMPVAGKTVHLFSEERRSTIPLNLAYIAACEYVKADKGVEHNAHRRYLRTLQEMTAVDGAHTNDEEVIVGAAAVVGFNEEKFRTLYRSPEVKRIYAQGKETCKDYEVHSFPSFRLQYRGEEMMVRGFTTYETLCHCISQLSYENIKPLSDGRERPSKDNIRNFMTEYGTAYPVEIATAFSMSRNGGHTALNVESYVGLPDIIDELVKEGKVAMAPKGNGFIFYTLKEHKGFSQRRSETAAVVQ